MGRRLFVLLLVLLACGGISAGQDLRIGVLGLFHPRRLELRASRAEALVVSASDQTFVLEPNSREAAAKIAIADDQLVVVMDGRQIRAYELHAAGRMGGASFLLSVPGEVTRTYHGTLAIVVKNGELTPIVTMDLETAVASVVQAESAPQTPLEALKAQAVVTRSYLAAGKGRHENFDFCDLTHCQVLRGPPAPDSPAAIAAEETRGLALTYQNKPFAAMFTRSCGGRTRAPAEVGLPINGYPYFPVTCDHCHKNPFRWTRTVSRQDAALLLAKGEAGRLAVDRRLGWNAIPSNSFSARWAGNEVILEGQGQGHGIGLCQLGAKAMAARGATYRAILRHYFPNTEILSVPRGTDP
jgi:stage II sporulation protein D